MLWLQHYQCHIPKILMLSPCALQLATVRNIILHSYCILTPHQPIPQSHVPHNYSYASCKAQGESIRILGA